MPAAVAFVTKTLAGIYSGIGISGLTSTLLASATLRLGASYLLARLSQSMIDTPSPGSQARELSQPSERPPYRFVYGTTKAAGSPVAIRVRGNILYACWLLNSRPSAGDFTLYLEDREVAHSGDPYDFETGATATNAPFAGYLKFWIGRGDQTAPPAQFLSEVPWTVSEDDLFKATDAWKGRTVLWARIDAGPQGSRNDRWPAAPPQVKVLGAWSKVWDPREELQDADDPDTWTYSDNHALCCLDALRRNPIEAYRLANIDIDRFTAAADICDQAVALKAGGTEPRYRVSGTLVWSGGAELEDQVLPLFRAGAARVSRVGGKISIVPGVARTAVSGLALTDALGSGLDANFLARGDDLATQVRVSYLSAARGYEEAELTPWDIPGAQDEDGGAPRVVSFALHLCASATQAMRVRKILGLDLRRQKTLGLVLPPEAVQLVDGSVVPVSFPAPFDALNGTYEVTSIHPALDLTGQDGVALRCPATLRIVDADQFDWTAATEEEEIEIVEITESAGLLQPEDLAYSVEEIDNGGTILTQIAFTWTDPNGAEVVQSFEWRARVEGATTYQSGSIAQGGGLEASFIIDPTKTYEISVRAIGSNGHTDWVVLDGVTAGLVLASVDIAAEPARVRITGTAPGLAAFDGIRIYRGATDDFGAATALGDVIAVTAGAAFDVVEGDATAVDVVTNGGFDADTDWTKGAGWSIGSGVATHGTGTTSDLSQAATLTASANYRWTFTVSGRTAATVRVEIDGDTTALGDFVNFNGLAQGTLTAPTNPTDIVLRAHANFDGNVDDFIMVADSAEAIPQGAAYFWAVPVTATGSEGTPSDSFNLTIP